MTTHASLPEDTMIDLMAYADGELEGADLARVERLLTENAEAARVVDSFHTLGACLRVTEADRRVPKIVDRIVDDVMVKLPKKAEVIPLAPRAVRMRNAILTGTVSALIAAAAGWAMFFRGTGDVPMQPGTEMVAVHTAKPAAPKPKAPEEIPALPVEGTSLDGVESPSQVSVFYVPGPDEKGSSVVVWVGEDTAANVTGGH